MANFSTEHKSKLLFILVFTVLALGISAENKHVLKKQASSYLKSRTTDSDVDELYSRTIHTEILLSLNLERQIQYFAKFAPTGVFVQNPTKAFRQEIMVEGPSKLAKFNFDLEKTTLPEEFDEIFGAKTNFPIKQQAKEWLQIPIDQRCEKYCSHPGNKRVDQSNKRSKPVYSVAKHSLICKCECFGEFKGERCEKSPCDELREYKRKHWDELTQSFPRACGSGTCSMDQTGKAFCQCPPGIQNHRNRPFVDVKKVGRVQGCTEHIDECDTIRVKTWGETIQSYISNKELKGMSFTVQKTINTQQKTVYQTVNHDTCDQPLRKYRNTMNFVKCENKDSDKGRYVCNCPKDDQTGKFTLYGRNCQFDVDECSISSPCSSGQTCVNLFGGFKCGNIAGLDFDDRIDFTNYDKQIFFKMGINDDVDSNSFKDSNFLKTSAQKQSGSVFYNSLKTYNNNLNYLQADLEIHKSNVSDSIRDLYNSENQRVSLNEVLLKLKAASTAVAAVNVAVQFAVPQAGIVATIAFATAQSALNGIAMKKEKEDDALELYMEDLGMNSVTSATKNLKMLKCKLQSSRKEYFDKGIKFLAAHKDVPEIKYARLALAEEEVKRVVGMTTVLIHSDQKALDACSRFRGSSKPGYCESEIFDKNAYESKSVSNMLKNINRNGRRKRDLSRARLSAHYRRKRSLSHCASSPHYCSLFGFSKQASKDVGKIYNYVTKPGSKADSDLDYDRLPVSLENVTEPVVSDFIGQLEELNFDISILSLAANNLIPGMEISSAGVKHSRSKRSATFVDEIQNFQNMVMNKPITNQDWFDEMNSHKAMERYMSELNVKMTDRKYTLLHMAMFANELVMTMNSGKASNFASVFFTGSSQRTAGFFKSIVGPKAYTQLQPLMTSIKGSKGMLKNIGTHIKQFGDGSMQKMFKFAKIGNAAAVIGKVVKALSVVDLVMESVQLSRQITATHYLKNRVLPYVVELSKLLENFDKLVIKILEDKNRVLRNLERYRFAVDLNAGNENGETETFPLPPKQRFSIVYNLISELVEISNEQHNLSNENKKLAGIPDPMCQDLSANDLKMYDEDSDTLKTIKEAANFEALLYLAHEEEIKQEFLNSDAKDRKRRAVSGDEVDASFKDFVLTKSELMDKTDGVFEILKEIHEQFGVNYTDIVVNL